MQQAPRNSLRTFWKLAHSAREVTVSCKHGSGFPGLSKYSKLATHTSSASGHASPRLEGWSHKQKSCRVTLVINKQD